MSGSGRDALKDVRSGRQALLDVWDWLGGPSGCRGVVGRPSQKSGKPFRNFGRPSRKTGRPSRKFGKGREASWKSENSWKASQKSGKGRKDHSEVREWQ